MKIMENIRYSDEAGAYGIGDLYLPENVTADTKLALCIHGGGWGGLDKSRMDDISGFLCRDVKMAVFNINYRLSTEVKWPACGDDCIAAAWALLNGDISEASCLDRRKVLVLGGSAGGHLALMTGLRLPPERVLGIISISGINSVVEDHAHSPGRYSTLFGHEPAEEELHSIDPLNYLVPSSPPVLCTHDICDNVVPCKCTEHFSDAAENVGSYCRKFVYKIDEDGFSHRIFFPGTTRLYPEIEAEIAAFIHEICR